MNTPRTKPPIRYSPKIKEAPAGGYTAGVSNMGLAAVIGNIITVWPHLEEQMVYLFGELIGIEDVSSARLIFRSIINQNTRINIMTAMLQKSPLHKSKPIDFDQLIAEFASLNKMRNAYAHGLWYTYQDEKRIFIEEETETYDKFFDKREVTEKELNGVLRRMTELAAKLLDRHIKDLTARKRGSSPQKPSQPSSGSSQEKPPQAAT